MALIKCHECSGQVSAMRRRVRIAAPDTMKKILDEQITRKLA
jgi:hypothetical protein